VDGLARLAGIAREETKHWNINRAALAAVGSTISDGWLINGGQLSCQPQAVRNRLIFKALQETTGSVNGRGTIWRGSTACWAGQDPPGAAHGHNVRVGLIYTDLLFARDLQESQPFCYPVSVPGKTAVQKPE
jgi:hypothetical protein